MQQCNKIFDDKFSADDAFTYSLCLGRVNNNMPIMRYMIDMYNRDRLNYVLQKEGASELLIPEWKKNHSKYCKKITSMKGKSITSKICAGMKTYIKRICPRLRLNPNTKIIDDLYQISEYLTLTTNLIRHILSNKEITNTPFQVTFLYIFTIYYDNLCDLIKTV